MFVTDCSSALKNCPQCHPQTRFTREFGELNATSGPHREHSSAASFSLVAISPCSYPDLHQQLQPHNPGSSKRREGKVGRGCPSLLLYCNPKQEERRQGGKTAQVCSCAVTQSTGSRSYWGRFQSPHRINHNVFERIITMTTHMPYVPHPPLAYPMYLLSKAKPSTCAHFSSLSSGHCSVGLRVNGNFLPVGVVKACLLSPKSNPNWSLLTLQ